MYIFSQSASSSLIVIQEVMTSRIIKEFRVDMMAKRVLMDMHETHLCIVE